MVRKRKPWGRWIIATLTITIFIFGSTKGIAWIKTLTGRGELELKKIGTIPYQKNEDTIIQPFENHIALYNQGKLAVYNSQGQMIWEKEQRIENPILHSSGKLLFLGDKDKGEIYSFDTLGNVVFYVKPGKAFRDMACNQGYMVLWGEEKELGGTIFIYDPKGQQKGIIHLNKGHIVDGAVSKDGEMVALSVLDVENDQLKTNVILYGAKGKLLGGNLYENEIITKLFFHGDNRLFHVGDRHLMAFEKEKGLLWSREIDGSVHKMAWNPQGFAVLSLVNNKKMMIDTKNRNYLLAVDMDGKELGRTAIKGDILGIDTRGKNIVTFTRRTLYVFSKEGKGLGEKKVYNDLQNVCMLTNDTMVLVLSNRLEMMRIKK
ncbi:DUF5711 family protein [Thermotalea metallivorans]|uniref:Outer membrane protein assembly factor BamB n=1 Tax=Thermotalea metallivorans TaxID=520762 RepID=A0A140L007_9FIRM|nr:DUF5711 family protein [Thermotalea metallivorans]KXG73882.1 hypothetical protein AN619_28020 [Thermotalea metallivorans]